jgi:hypothetical protein
VTTLQGCVKLIAHAYAKKKCVLSSSSGLGDRRAGCCPFEEGSFDSNNLWRRARALSADGQLAASGGEEMLRLRAYEKLQNLVSRGMVKKSGKKYRGLASLAKALVPPAELTAVGK